MARPVLAAMLASVALFDPAEAAAQDSDEFERAARETRLQDSEPVVVLMVTGAFGDPADTFSFYSFWDKPYGTADRRRGYAVRKASRTESAPVWATSFDCASLEALLERLERVPAPRINIWGIGDDVPPSLVVDGVSYDLWTRWPAWPGATGYSLRMSGNVNTPLAEWANGLYRDLAPCWSIRAPGSAAG